MPVIVPFMKPQEAVSPARFQTRPCTTSDSLWSEPTIAKKQPTQVGYPYQIHAPLAAFKALPTLELSALLRANAVFEEISPLFLRTNQPFVRVKLRYGDEATANLAASFLLKQTRRVYKNWV